MKNIPFILYCRRQRGEIMIFIFWVLITDLIIRDRISKVPADKKRKEKTSYILNTVFTKMKTQHTVILCTLHITGSLCPVQKGRAETDRDTLSQILSTFLSPPSSVSVPNLEMNQKTVKLWR